MNTELAG